MLYLLNNIPSQTENWQLIGSMLTTDDSLLLYEQAVKLVADAESPLLAFLSQGVKLYVLVEPVDKVLSISDMLVNQVKAISWDDFVDLTANESGVCSI